MKYFAYGSNMDAQRMRERGIEFSERVHAILSGYSLKFNKMADRNHKEGYANIVPDKNNSVEGVLYEIPDLDLKKLDKHECYPIHYDRIKINVRTGGKKEVEAIIYVAQPDKVKQGLKPSNEYLAHLLAGKDILSESYYLRLESLETLATK
jgi:cation transport regulator ChaC